MTNPMENTTPLEKYSVEQLPEQIPSWVREAKEQAIGHFPDDRIETEIWPLIEKAGENFLSFAQGRGTDAAIFSKSGFFMKLRADFAHHSISWDAATTTDIESPVVSEVLPSLVDTGHSTLENSSVEYSPETSPDSPDDVAETNTEDNADAPVSRDAKLERLLAFQEKLKQARGGASNPAPAPSPVSVPEERKKVSSFADLKELLPEERQTSLPEEADERASYLETSPNEELPASPLATPVAPPEDLPASLAQGSQEENLPSVETVPAPPSVQEKTEEAKTERRRNEIRDLIKEGRGREVPLGVLLTYLSVDGVKEHLDERYNDVLSGKESITELRRSDLFLLHRHAPLEVGKLALAEIQQHPEWIPRTLPGEAERAITAINEGHGETIPEGVLYRNAFYPEIARYLKQRGLAVPPERPAPPTSDSQPSDIEGRMQRSIESGAFDLTLATEPQLNALLRHPTSSIQSRAREELARREGNSTQDADVPLVTSEYEAWEKESLSVDPYWSAVEKQEETEPQIDDPYWSAMNKQVAPYSQSPLAYEAPKGMGSDAGNAPKKEVPAVTLEPEEDFPEVYSTETMPAMSDPSPSLPQDENEMTSSSPKKEEPLTLEGELVSSPSENQEKKEMKDPTPEERWSALSPEDKKVFVGECEFFFTPGKSYRVSETEDARLVRFLPDTGEALMLLQDGSERTIPLFALRPLNTFEGTLEAEESAEVSQESLTHKWIKTMQESAGLVDVPGFEAGETINLPDGTPGWRVFGLSVAEGMVLVGLLSEDGEKIAQERKISLEEFRAHNVVSRESTPPKKEKPIEPEDRMMQEFVREQFKETFGIDEEALLAIPEFAALSPGRQLLVHNELNNYAVTQIKADALVAYREQIKTSKVALSSWEKKLSEGKGVFGAFGKLAVGVSQFGKHATERVGNSLFKKKIVTDYEKQFAKDFSEGKFDPKEFIRDLALQAAEGPEAIIDKDRKVKLQFLNVCDIEGGVTGEEARVIAEFNAVAEQFASTPHQWIEHGATEKDRASYEKKEEAYRARLDRVLEILRSRGDDASALLDVNELDRRITFTQFFNTHPEAAVQLAQLRDQSSALAFMKSAAVERGGLMAFGATVRTVAAVAIAPVFAGATLVAAPLVGAISGGVMGKRRASGELEERDILATRGVRDTSAEARNVVSSGRRKNKEGVDRNGLTGKLEELIKQIEATSDDEVDTTQLARQAPAEDGTRGAVRAEGELGTTLDSTSPLVESGRTITRDKRVSLLAELDRRIEYTQVKIDKGLIDFGGKQEQIKNRYALLRALASAKALRAESLAPELDVSVDEKGELYDNTWRTDLRSASERLEDILRLHEQNISEAQKAYVRKSARRAALYGATFAFGGALVADLAQGDGSVVRSVVEDVMKDDAPEVAGTAATVAGITPRAPSALGQEVVPPTMNPVASAETLVTPPSVGSPVSQEAIERALREGWSGGLLEKAQQDPLFNGDMVRGYTSLALRAEDTGISQVEYNALLASQGKPAFKELMDAMRVSPETLPDEKVAEIMVRNGMPTSLESVASSVAPSAGGVGEVVREASSPVLESVHGVEQGETLTSVIRALPSLKGLSSSAQDNVIQNFLHRASDAELLSIGVDDPSRLSLGQEIDLAKLNEILATKRIGDSSLIEHAKQLFGGEEVTPVSGGTLANEAVGQASGPAATPPTVASVAPNTAPTAPTPASVAPAETVLPEPPKAIPPVETAPSPRVISIESSETPTAAPPLAETVLTPREIERMASEQLVKNMSDPITKDPLPLWLEMRRYNAYDVIRIREEEVTPEVWQKVEWVRQYMRGAGLDRDDLIPGKQESVDQFLRRGHAKLLEVGEVKEVKPIAPPPPVAVVSRTGANVPPPVIRQPIEGASPVSSGSRVVPTLSRPRPDDVGFTPRSVFTDTASSGKGTPPLGESSPLPVFKPRTLPKW